MKKGKMDHMNNLMRRKVSLKKQWGRTIVNKVTVKGLRKPAAPLPPSCPRYRILNARRKGVEGQRKERRVSG